MLVFRQVSDQEELNAVFRLRYEVYCLEKKYLDSNNYNGYERDKYDDYAVNFLALETDDNHHLLGCFRLIPNNPYGFPCELHYNLNFKADKRDRTAELSRMIVAPCARSMWRHVLMGLSKEVYIYNTENNILYNYAAMDYLLIVALQRMKLPFKIIGESGSYMGETIPSVLDMVELEKTLPQSNAWLYEYLKSPREDQQDWF